MVYSANVHNESASYDVTLGVIKDIVTEVARRGVKVDIFTGLDVSFIT